MKQTAVEWLRQELLKRDMDISIKDLFIQAKEMHKQEIIDAYSAGEDNIDNDGCSISRNGKETYYNKTYGK